MREGADQAACRVGVQQEAIAQQHGVGLAVLQIVSLAVFHHQAGSLHHLALEEQHSTGQLYHRDSQLLLVVLLLLATILSCPLASPPSLITQQASSPVQLLLLLLPHLQLLHQLVPRHGLLRQLAQRTMPGGPGVGHLQQQHQQGQQQLAHGQR